ncbi:hypothetical protein BC830DRAFT_890938 [Chytriomyces sp. MP71]|nr:hypothetical protein BC830DRAFT_890938 [Chytriomyces sp. MP71]
MNRVVFRGDPPLSTSFHSSASLSVLSSLSLSETESASAATQHQHQLGCLDANQLKLRSAHLTRLLRETQQTVAEQKREISVLRKALVDHSSASISHSSDLLHSASVDSALLEKNRGLEARVASLGASLDEQAKERESLCSQLKTKDDAIDALTASLNKAVRDLARVQEENSSIKAQLSDLKDMTRRDETRLVEGMLAKATNPLTSSKATIRGRPRVRHASRVLENTVASANKIVSTLTTAAPVPAKTNLKRSARRLPTTNPHDIASHPACRETKHARARSYDARLRLAAREGSPLKRFGDAGMQFVVHEATDRVDPFLEDRGLRQDALLARGREVYERSVEALQARAIKAELERNALEEELLRVLREVNERGLATGLMK